MADNAIPTGEEVFCHQCESRWRRSEHGLQCPNCESEFVEILENHPEPHERTPPPPPSQPPFSPPPHPLHDHNPWQDDVPDPDEDDITTFEFTTGPTRITFASTTVRSNGRLGGRNIRGNDPALDQLHNNFQTMLTSIIGSPTMARGIPNGPGHHTAVFGFPGHPLSPGSTGLPGSPGPEGFGGRNTNNATGRIWPQEPRTPPPGPGPAALHDILSILFQGLGEARAENGPRGNAGGPPGFNPFMLFGPLFGNPANAAHGDAVFTQEALDRVISQLMEQTAGSNAPGPASEAAIQALPKKQVDQEMLGSDGKAECSICMDNVTIGDEVTVLPCKHWFHGECVTSWLKEHDTCPHCRQGISKDGNVTNAETSMSPSAAPSPAPEGSRNNPFVIPGSPEQSSRWGPYEHRSHRGESGEWRETFERPRRTSRQNSSRQESNSGSGGGITGWVRNRFGGGGHS